MLLDWAFIRICANENFWCKKEQKQKISKQKFICEYFVWLENKTDRRTNNTNLAGFSHMSKADTFLIFSSSIQCCLIARRSVVQYNFFFFLFSLDFFVV